ncbi:hypothetical protein [Anaerotignum sp.]|uniref:hypothetical protein n=1 Tax=Anaerotignum sp. TaxID=2039241 RepID=UPI002A9095D1|nr:hypothetical protein [Anaerotignum sp.]MCI7657836.1 hypothetical protein [Clostridia bacterium]MDY5415769.1 hypothetical protein [Anaerotignum sp.]
MERIREEYKKLSRFAVLFVIPWLILFNLLLCWLDMTFPKLPLPLFLLLYVLILATIFSLGYVCGKRRCPVLALAAGCLQYLLYNLLSFLPVSLGLEHSWQWSEVLLPLSSLILPLVLLIFMGMGYLSGRSTAPKADEVKKAYQPLFPKAYLLYLVPWMLPLIYGFEGTRIQNLPFFVMPLLLCGIFLALFLISLGCKKKFLLFGMGLQLCYLILGALHLDMTGIFFSLFFLPCISPFFVVQIMGCHLGKTAD